MPLLFWLKKAVTYFLLPLQLSLTLMLLGGILVWLTRRKILGRLCLTSGLLLLLGFSLKPVGRALLGPLETRYAPIPELAVGEALPPELAECRAIVVFAGGAANTARLPATLRLSEAGLARLVEGVRLARLLPEATLILTGPARDKGAPESETAAATLARAAESLGIEPQRMRLLTTALDTEGEVAALAALYGPNTPLALISSAAHMPRIMAYAEKAGLHALPCPANFAIRPDPKFRWNEYSADISGLTHSTGGIYERLGLLWAYLRGKA
ncbi:hypothetical protein AXK12_00190 [Cephaloticoccus capnophilus]|uniref:DUF218 domain-containing protein n=1 Tax=Cephaloticoccus capnophilus TaxID=1548208 RepID=A0A139SKE8_9BACT|nr:ElyC/SanA/YdcF family protein [Cephaloticoccus capnophilus]KXU35025.1 hypothetical protein AXK12_00190 [Cephaloticoccus capnophilus]